MFNFIEKLKNRSEEERRVLALGTSAVVTLFIGVLWLSSGSGSLEGTATVSQQATALSAQPLSPLASLRETLVSIFQASPTDLQEETQGLNQSGAPQQ